MPLSVALENGKSYKCGLPNIVVDRDFLAAGQIHKVEDRLRDHCVPSFRVVVHALDVQSENRVGSAGRVVHDCRSVMAVFLRK